MVIDLGLEKLPYFDARANTDTLLLRRCARASAVQRAGRAGRVAPGICLRLYPSAFIKDVSIMPAYTPAEMERTSLLNLVLKVRMMEPEVPPAQLLDEAIQPPTGARVAAAVSSLVDLGALCTHGANETTAAASAVHELGLVTQVTALGRLVAALPVSVPMGRLLVLGEALGCGRQAALLAALLTLPDPFLQPYTRADGTAAVAPPAEIQTDGAAEVAAAVEDATFFKPRLVHFTARGCSDPLAGLALFEEWQRLLSVGGPPAAAQYAQSQKASYKRLSEIEYLSRELLSRLRTERAEHGLALPPSGAAGVADGGPNLITLQALLSAAFLPNIAIGRVSCPPTVLEEISRHRLDPKRSVAFIVASGSAPGAHLTQAHLSAALKPCGKLEQSFITKSRVVVNGVASLQTSAVCAFASAEGALLALRMAGMRASLPVPLSSPEGKLVGTAYLQKPQYPCRLRFSRLTSIDTDAMGMAPQFIDDSATADDEPAPAAPPGGSGTPAEENNAPEVLPVDMLWHSGSAVLSAADTADAERFLLATAWSRAGYRRKLLAHGASLLPSKPVGAAQLFILTFSRFVSLITLPENPAMPTCGTPSAAVAVLVGDGEHTIRFALPWLLRASDLVAINELRAALSASVGEDPATEAEPAAALQLMLMKLLIEKRPPLNEGLAQIAAAAASQANPIARRHCSPFLLPPIEPPLPASPGVFGATSVAPVHKPSGDGEASVSDPLLPSTRTMAVDGGASGWTRDDEDEELELLEL